MKKIRNLVIGGIESKVAALVLVSMLLVAAVFWRPCWRRTACCRS